VLLGSLAAGFVLEIALLGGIRRLGSSGGLLSLGAVDGLTTWAAGAVGPKAVFEAGEWWRLFTPVLLHGSVIHLLFNGFALNNLGKVADQLFGGPQYLLVFLASGVVGNLASCGWKIVADSPSLSVGASGAVCGLLGVLLAHMRRRVDVVAQHLARQLLGWAVFILVMGIVVERVDNAAHVGGFVTGYVLAKVLPSPHFLMVGKSLRHRWPEVTAVVLAAATLVACVVGAAGASGRRETLDRAFELHAVLEAALENHQLGREDALQGNLKALRILGSDDPHPVLERLRKAAIGVLEAPAGLRAPGRRRLRAAEQEALRYIGTFAPDLIQKRT